MNTIPNLTDEQTKKFQLMADSMEKAKQYQQRKTNYEYVMNRAQQQVTYWKSQRSGTHEQIEEADSYITQYTRIRNEAEIKLLKLVLDH